MHDMETRTAALRLAKEGHSERTIARALGISRGTVRRILDSGTTEAVPGERSERLRPEVDRVRELYTRCRGNLVRVHEELAAAGIDVAYTTLTAFCRRNQIGKAPKPAAGQYTFAPGGEMQHDTSPHTVEIGGRVRHVQCASVVLCWSRMLFAQVYPTFDRFHAKVPDRGADMVRRRRRSVHGRQHKRDHRPWDWAERGGSTRDGGIRGAIRIARTHSCSPTSVQGAEYSRRSNTRWAF